MARRRPTAPQARRPAARRRRQVPETASALADPWSLETLIAEIEDRVSDWAAAHPDKPPEDWLYQVLDAWVADRDDSWRRHREAEGLPLIQEPACQEFCNHCCYQHVYTTEIEAEILARYFRDHASVAERDALRDRLERHGELDRQLVAESPDPEALRASRGRVRLPCPVLDEASGRCRAYEARPVNCRRENSVDVEVCRRYRSDPDATESSLRLIRYDLLWGAVQIALAHRGTADVQPEDLPHATEPLTVALSRHFL